MHKLANAVKNKVHRLHRKTSEYQHYRYRQSQLSALASPRRTARNERIPPDGFDMTTLEVALRGRIPPPPNGGPLCPAGISPPRGESPFSRKAYILPANAVKTKFTRLHQKTPEYQHYRYRQGQPPALANPRRTARATSEFRRTVSTWLH